MSLCKDCIKGVQHEGTPTGAMEMIGGVECYVATPQVECPKDKVLLFLTDVYGHTLINSQLLADDFAANGFKTFDWNIWLVNHGAEVTRPPLDKIIAALKEQGVRTFGASGYCFGVRYAMDLAFENITKAIVISHPSFLQIPEDLEMRGLPILTLKARSNNPTFVNSCEFDEMFPVEKQKMTDDMLGNGQYKPGYTQAYFPGCTHGFAARGDPSTPEVKAGKEGAFKNAVEFFIKHL